MKWRLIYNSGEIITLFKTSDITLTNHNVYESENIEDCFNLIVDLKLNFEFVYNNIIHTFIDGVQKVENIDK